MKLALSEYLATRGGSEPKVINEKAKREAAGLPAKKERIPVRQQKNKQLANAERVADEAIAALESLHTQVWNYVDGMQDEVITDILRRAKDAADRLRQELEGE